MPYLAARQMRGQQLAFWLLLALGGHRRRLQLSNLDDDGRQNGFDLVVEQAALFGIEALRVNTAIRNDMTLALFAIRRRH